MGRLANLLARAWTLERADPSLVELLGGYETAAGVRVNEQTALRASAVFACVRVITEDIAKLPLILYRRLEEGKERAVGHPLYPLLRHQPNPVHTAFRFRELMMQSLLLWGNAYAYIDRNEAGRPRALWYLHPDAVQPERLQLQDGRHTIIYRVTIDGLGQEVYTSDYILHIPCMGFDGVKGVSVLRYARESIGTFLAAQEFSGRFFGNDTTPGLVMVAPRQLTDDERQTLHQQFRVRYEGASRKFRMAIVDQGWELKPLGVNLEDAQFVQLMKFGIEEIARLFRVPPHKIGHLERATFSNIEHQGIEHQTDTLEPYVVRWEQELEAKLLLPSERQDYTIEFLMDAVLRADTESRFRAYATGIQWGVMTPNEARARENLNPVAGGDNTWMPVNMLPTDRVNAASPETEAGARSVEARANKRGGPALRARLARAHAPVFRETAGRIIRREVRDIRRAVEKHLTERSASSFGAWLAQYYLEAPTAIKRDILPVSRAYAEAVVAAAGEEIGVDGTITPAIEELVRDIVDGFAASHASKTRNYINKRLQQILASGGDLQAELYELLDELEEIYPEKVAQREPIRLGGAVARAFFFGAGITTLVWVTAGPDPCPLCLSLSGQAVGQGGNFLRAGDTIEVGGADPLTAEHPVGHPPLHDGCECMIAPG